MITTQRLIYLFLGFATLSTLLSISIPTYQHFRGTSNAFPELDLHQQAFQTVPKLVQEPEREHTPDQKETPTYKFINPKIANGILSQIDLVNTTHNVYKFKLFEEPWYGMKRNDQYCQDHRAFFTQYADILFRDVNFITTYPTTSMVREKFLGSVGNDVEIGLGDHMPNKTAPKFNHKPYVNAYFTKNPLTSKFSIGKHVACTTQVYNRIPGHTSLDQKDNVAENAITYAKQFKDRPFCFNHDKFFPETWLLDDEQDCKDFFQIMNSERYEKLKAERSIVYIRKVAAFSHRGEGVFPISAEEEVRLRQDYGNGTLCGKDKRGEIVQYYIYNPLLINGRKFDFRMYMLIASTNPLMAYYHDGFLRVTLASYDSHSTDKKALLTNLALNKQIYDQVKGGQLYEGMSEEDLKIAQQWSFERLHEYLMEAGIVKDPNWLDKYLRPEFKKAMVHLLRLSHHTFHEHSALYELYGVDFMLDENLNLWFIEANSSPALYGYSQPMEKFILKMLRDHMEVVVSLLRSRMKRIVTYVNELTTGNDYKVRLNGFVEVFNLKSKQETFKSLVMNRMEKEFEPSAENGFSKIVDFNYNGAERYQNLIMDECL